MPVNPAVDHPALHESNTTNAGFQCRITASVSLFVRPGRGMWVGTKLDQNLGLPIELVEEIFLLALGRYIGRISRWLHAWHILCGTCWYYRAVIQLRSIFWDDYVVSPHCVEAELREWISHFGARPRDLRFHFDDPFGFRRSSPTSNVPWLSSARTIELVGAYASDCRCLCLRGEARREYPAFVRLLQQASASNLISLSLYRNSDLDINDDLPPLDTEPAFFAGSDVPFLRFLRLCNAVVGWNDLCMYKGLDVFVVHSIKGVLKSVSDPEICHLLGVLVPSGPQFWRVLVTMESVRYMSIRNLGCGPLPSNFSGAIILPSLIELDLSFCDVHGVADVLAGCRADALRTVAVSIYRDEDLCCLAKCSALLAGVTRFKVRGWGTTVLDVAALYRCLPSLRFLDLSKASPAYFTALCTVDVFASPLLFSSLNSLAVTNVGARSMRRYMMRRIRAGMPLCKVVLFDVPPYARYTSHLRWISRVLKGLAFRVDPDDAPEPEWMSHD
ncbi:hypothetical protein FB451DRAFT_1414464 [Mycena latifolia]|nr:hypothetical protein FB451DRAFT_1414464 [Mycena latifolia]